MRFDCYKGAALGANGSYWDTLQVTHFHEQNEENRLSGLLINSGTERHVLSTEHISEQYFLRHFWTLLIYMQKIMLGAMQKDRMTKMEEQCIKKQAQTLSLQVN